MKYSIKKGTSTIILDEKENITAMITCGMKADEKTWKKAHRHMDLLVSTPELLEACKNLVGCLDSMGFTFPEDCGIFYDLAKAREAIRKAEGN